MPTTLPMPTKAVGEIFTTTLWNSCLRDNMNKLLNTGHRVLTVAQFNSLTGLEGTKGTVAPDEVYLEVDAANGVQWHLAYESGETTYKWRFLGGPPMVSEVTTSEATASGAYVALTTGGPSIALPRAGDFDVTTDALITAGTGAAVDQGYMSYDIGGTGAVDADSHRLGVFSPATSNASFVHHRLRRKTVATAVTLTSKYRTNNSTSVTFANRSMSVTPVRLV